MGLKVDDIIFFILLGAALAIIIWLLHGSPPVENGATSVGTIIISSVVLLWRKYYQMESSMKVSFNNVKHDMANLKTHIDSRFERVERLLQRK